MKKLFFLIPCLFPFLAFSQFSLGLEAGAHLSTIVIKEPSGFEFNLDESHKYLVGYRAGLIANYQGGERVKIQSGLAYSRLGYKNDRVPLLGGGAIEESNTYLHYLAIPLTLQHQIVGPIWLLGGVEASYLLDAKVKVNSVEEKLSVKDSWKKGDLAFKVGAAWQITDHLQIKVAYQQGLVNLMDIQYTDENGEPASKNPKSTNRSFSTTVSYTLLGS